MRVYLSFKQNPRHIVCRHAFQKSLKVIGWEEEKNPYHADLIIGWGGAPEHLRMMDECRSNGKKFLMVDLGYWNRRRRRDAVRASYKITINSIHPNAYFNIAYGGEKYDGPPIAPPRRGGRYILVAGMGPKGCKMYGMEHGQWDREAVRILRDNTDMPIIYRSKPSDKGPIRIEGTTHDYGQRPIAGIIRHAALVVTHHGNSALDAMWAGVPCYAAHGPGRFASAENLVKALEFNNNVDKKAIFDHLAWFNWLYADIMEGRPLLHLRDKGII